MEARLLFLHALSPLHAGTGQGVGVVDLPTAREKSTGIPFLPGSSVKGVLRDRCEDVSLRHRVFGPDTDRADDYASSVQVTDARLLLLPVRSLAGTFAWVTCPLLLRRLLRDTLDTNTAGSLGPAPATPDVETCLVCKANPEIQLSPDGQAQVILEDILLRPEPSDDAAAWAAWLGERLFPADEAWRKMLNNRLCIVHDDLWSFLLETATEIIARIRLDGVKKTVAQGALWYEEALPVETILSALIIASPVKSNTQEVFETVGELAGGTVQLGGHATIGRGLCRAVFVKS